jgi:autotransporter passenger strand-loop-strand repeat protein
VFNGGSQDIFSGAEIDGEIVISGALYVFSGGEADFATLSSGGVQYVGAPPGLPQSITEEGQTLLLSGGGSAFGTVVSNGGIQAVYAGGIAVGTSLSGGTASTTGAYQVVSSGGSASNTELESGGYQDVYFDGGVSGTIFAGGHQDIFSGAEVSGAQVSNGVQNIFSSGEADDTQVFSGGLQNVGASAGLAASLSGGGYASQTVLNGGEQDVYAGATASGTMVNDGGYLYVADSGTASGAIVGSGGFVYVESGAMFIDASVSSDGDEYDEAGGDDLGTTVGSGGTEFLSSGGNASGTIIDSGGIEYVYGTESGATASGGTQIVESGGSAFDLSTTRGLFLTIASGGYANFADGVSATSTVISNGGTLEIDGNFSGTVTFAGTSGTLIIDQLGVVSGGKAIQDFQGSIAGLTVGDQIVLKNTNLAAGNAVIDASLIQASTYPQGLEIMEANSGSLNPTSGMVYFDVASSSAPNGGFSDEFVDVTQSANGDDTVLTLDQGNPVALAVNAPTAQQTFGVTGAGITIGIISDSFDRLGGEAADIQNGLLPSTSSIDVLADGFLASDDDEGRAMAQVVHDIAPGAAIDFYTADSGSTYVQGIKALQAAGAQIIVDDIGIPPPGNSLESRRLPQAINAVVAAGATFVSAAGNDRANSPPYPIYGHSADPYALTVAAMNLLATPSSVSSVGGYLPADTEPFSSIGTSSAKPNLTGPDGDPTSFDPRLSLSPFFGTSAAAPAVAAVAALMMQANPLLESEPLIVDQLLEATALPFGEPANEMGAGFVQATGAVAAALAAVTPFYTATDPPGLYVASALVSQMSGDIDTGSSITFQLNMNSGVTITGTPTLLLNDGGSAVYNPEASNLTSGILVFEYTVGATDETANLAITGVGSGTTIADANGDIADFSGLFDVPTGVTVNSPLVVTSVANPDFARERRH